MDGCIFCKIIDKKLPAKIVYEDDAILAFEDISPKAPVHIVVIPKKHMKSLAELTQDDAGLMGRIMVKLPVIARDCRLEGYRVVVNTGTGAGQTVWHLHLHLMGGRSFSWPPG